MNEPADTSFRDAHFAAIVANSTDAIVSKDLNGVVISWNAAAERLFGWTAEEMIGESIRRIIPSDRQDEEDSILARVRAGELITKFETVRQTKAGAPVPIAVTVSPIRDAEGKIVGASKIAHDLREHSTLRQELRESQQQFAALAQNIPQLAWMADGKGWIYWYNQRWYDYTGTTLEQMQGWGWRDVHHPEHVDRVVERIQHSWDTGEVWEDTFPLRGADGEFRWFLSRANPLKDDEGNVLLWCGTNTDITEQREASERITLLMREVNHRARNMLSTVQAIVNRTASASDSELADALLRRIAALSANQNLLNEGDWVGAVVADIVASQILHVGDIAEGRIHTGRRDQVMLKPGPAEALGLAIHELATNAAKYGALANDTGEIDVTWGFEGEGEDRRFVMEWRERGGPPVEKPERKGFGTTIIERNPAFAMRADVTLDFDPAGLVWRISAPYDSAIAPDLSDISRPEAD
ncbi:PAS domain S-box protein [Qipengyuania soli]|uniref:histidine kinase n=1 Tax=Qipengyuania soli TaxID=2782568 RepID=A0A7S8IUK7_9SPHN|nr:PAS domain S-box protein [Qipengyuania soli]QPC97846.1 PAS domain S-box protein [Qipengyuania soli]